MKPETDFRKILATLPHTRTPLQVFEKFVRASACALAAQTREREYLEAVQGWSRPELETLGAALGALILEMNAAPFTDVLGSYYMEILGNAGQSWHGTFHTPQPVCELMARVLAAPAPAEGPIAFAEPACGSGAMILAYAATLPRADVRRLRVTASDISAVACDMTFINTTLWGIPCTVIHQNTLSLETWAQWRNVHSLIPFLYLLAPSEGEPAAVPADTPELAPEPADAIQIAPPPLLSPDERAAAVASQGRPPTSEDLAPLRPHLREQLDFQFLLEDAPAPYAA